MGTRSTQGCQRERTEVHAVSETEHPEPIRDFTIEERIAAVDLLIDSQEHHTERLRFLLVVLAPILSTLVVWTVSSSPLLQVIGGFIIYAGAATWLICGDTSPLRSHCHG
jgi:hypothetical protein